MTEALVLFACLNQTGCTETYSAYYHSNPLFRETITYSEAKMKKELGSTVGNTVFPFIYFFAGRPLRARVNKEIEIKLENDRTVYVTFTKGF